MGFSTIFGVERTKKTLIVVLVTGGTGFLGSVLIAQLLDRGLQVRATKRESSRIPPDLDNKPGLKWVEADVQDFHSLEKAFEGVQQVYHCAAKVSYQPADRAPMHRINVQGTANVVNLCLHQRIRLLHVSSIAALGEAKNGQETTEADLWEYSRDQSAYSVSKYESEMEVWRGIAEGLDAVIVNPSLIVGRSAGSRGSGQVFHLLYKGLRFYPGGSVGLVDVEDVARAMILLMEHPSVSGARFIVNNVNMAHVEMLSLSSKYLGKRAPSIRATPLMLEAAWRFARLFARLSGKKATLTKESARVSGRQLRFSNKKLTETIELDFKPIEQTLREICEQVLAHYQTGRR